MKICAVRYYHEVNPLTSKKKKICLYFQGYFVANLSILHLFLYIPIHISVYIHTDSFLPSYSFSSRGLRFIKPDLRSKTCTYSDRKFESLLGFLIYILSIGKIFCLCPNKEYCLQIRGIYVYIGEK